MPCARVGVQLGIGIDDTRGQAHRFGAGVETHEADERAAAAAVADLGAQGAIKPALRQAGRHHVGHHLRARHGVKHRRRRVAEAEHAVAAGVVQHRTLSVTTHGPRAASAT